MTHIRAHMCSIRETHAQVLWWASIRLHAMKLGKHLVSKCLVSNCLCPQNEWCTVHSKYYLKKSETELTASFPKEDQSTQKDRMLCIILIWQYRMKSTFLRKLRKVILFKPQTLQKQTMKEMRVLTLCRLNWILRARMCLNFDTTFTS